MSDLPQTHEAPKPHYRVPYRQSWLDRLQEQVVEPGLPIIDTHHHVWDLPNPLYMFPELLADAKSGHRVLGSVFIESKSMYRATGPDGLKSVGEIEFVNGVAAMSASGQYGPRGLCGGIVGYADLRMDGVEGVLAACVQASPRFRGVRQIAAWDSDPAIAPAFPPRIKDLLVDEGFRRGFRHLTSMGLSFDAYVHHPQLAQVGDIATAFPDSRIVLEHCGGPTVYGRFSGRRDEVFQTWRASMKDLARCDNVYVKLGGLGMRVAGFEFEVRETPASSDELAAAWGPYFQTCIEFFGPGRCMFESNFPVDKISCSYATLWNAHKKIVASYTPDEKRKLFFTTARDFYRVDVGVEADGAVAN